MKNIHLLGCKGCGSAIVEAALALAKIPYDYTEANYEDESQLKELLKVNPLGQVPVLILPDESILTESAAIINYINHQSPASGLIPQDKEQNILYWRWVCFIIGAIYPSFTYGDFPERWTNAETGPLLVNSTDEWRKKLWLQVESEVGDEFFIKNFSALDLYLAVMVHWRPRMEWFQENCPRITNIAGKVLNMPELQAVWKKHS